MQAIEAKPKRPDQAYSSLFDGADVVEVRELATLPALVQAPVQVDEDRIRSLLRSGAMETDVACTLNVTLARVLEVKRQLGFEGVRVTTKVTQQTRHTVVTTGDDEPVRMPSPKEIISQRVRDFQEVLDRAKQEYLDNPDSEANYNAMNGFMRTMDSLFKTAQNLDDPQDVAEKVIKHILAPFIKNSTKHYIDTAKKITDDLAATLSNDYQRATLNDELQASLRTFREQLREEYNRAVKTLEVVCEVKLDHLMMRPNLGGAPELST